MDLAVRVKEARLWETLFLKRVGYTYIISQGQALHSSRDREVLREVH